MSLTIAGQSTWPVSRVATFDITFDSSYPTGGESLVASDLGFTSIAYVLASNIAGYVVDYDHANKKLLLHRQKDPANAGGADIALTEFTSTGDASLVVAKIVVFGT